MITKNLQSIRADSRFHDFCTELVACDHDLIFICETWRSAVEECFVLPSGGQIFLSGGLSHQGVGIAVSGKMMAHLSDISFHPYSPRLCLLKFTFRGLNFHSLSCYFPTSWEDDASVDGMYELLTVVLEEIRKEGPIMIGGDFNSCLGGVQPSDSVDSLGCWGFGARNARGVQLANWVLQNGLQILSRQSDNQGTSESWTCERYFDEARVQLDANSIYDPQHLPGLEKELFDAGLKGGYSKQTRTKYESSNALRDLRAERRQAVERSIKKQLSFDIAKLHRRELRAWKSSRLQQLLNMPNQWKMLQKMSHTIVRQCAQHPPANDFADMLENIFHGHPDNPTRPLHLTEPNWSLQELNGAIKRLKMNKASDDQQMLLDPPVRFLKPCCSSG